MGPIIILDKSTLHGLSLHEIGALNRYYNHNIAPVLIVEILGDLKKKHSAALSLDKVAELALKAFPASSNVNAHYRHLLQASLTGGFVPMDGRIQLSGGRNLETSDGQKGVVFDETPEEAALLRWKQKQFSKAEDILAERWRSSTRSFDLDLFKRNLKTIYPKIPTISDHQSLFIWVQEILSQDNIQTDILKFILYEFNIEQSLAQQIFYRWETEGPRTLNAFAPYAHYCAHVAIFFNMGLIHDLITTRSTNRVDLEYLYYLPFCNAFCSGDKFHHASVPLFLRTDQKYFKKDQFKSDLSILSDDLYKHGPAGLDRTPDESITSSLWADLNMGKMTAHGWISPEQQEAGGENSPLVDFIKSRTLGRDIPDDSVIPGEEDFIMKETSILSSDPCPCGSRKPFEECHGKHIVEKMRRKSDWDRTPHR
jgi:hypothetical protein